MDSPDHADSGSRTVPILAKKRQVHSMPGTIAELDLDAKSSQPATLIPTRPAVLAPPAQDQEGEVRRTVPPSILAGAIPEVECTPMPSTRISQRDAAPLEAFDSVPAFAERNSKPRFRGPIFQEADSVGVREAQSAPMKSAADSATVELAPAEPTPAPEKCPKCGGKLISPEDLGWCMDCGYCHATAGSVPRVAAVEAETAARHSPMGLVETFRLIVNLPAWFWLSLGGVIFIYLFSSIADSNLRPDSRERALWSITQVAMSVAFLVGAQLWAVTRLASMDDRLGARDVFMPFRVWSVALKHPTRVQWPIFIGASALTLLITGFLVIGGFGYWLPAPPGRKAERPALLAVMSSRIASLDAPDSM